MPTTNLGMEIKKNALNQIRYAKPLRKKELETKPPKYNFYFVPIVNLLAGDI